MSWTARSSRVCIVDLLQHLGCEDEQHDLQRPDHMPVLVALVLSRKVVKQVKEGVTTLGQFLVCILLEICELVGICVHPVPNCLLQALHQHNASTLLQCLELGNGLRKQFCQPRNVNIDVLDQFNISVVRVLFIGVLQPSRDPGEHGAEVVEAQGEEDLGGQVLELVSARVSVSCISAGVQELTDLFQQQLHIHGLVIFYLRRVLYERKT